MTAALRNYTRWTADGAGALTADILGGKFPLRVDQPAGVVEFDGRDLTPDEARMYGVRLIEAAALADGGRVVRAAPEVELPRNNRPRQ